MHTDRGGPEKGITAAARRGATNYAQLQQVIAAKRERSNPDLLQQLRRAQGAELNYRAEQAWQD